MPKLPVIDWLRTSEYIEFFAYTRAGQRMATTELWVIEIDPKRLQKFVRRPASSCCKQFKIFRHK